MKYLILRKRSQGGGDPFLELAGAGSLGHDFQFPFHVDARQLKDSEVEDLRHDPNVEDVIPSIPFTLIQPLDLDPDGPVQQTAWGIEAVGAGSSPLDGDGVTVAVLDTGIDTTHPAFAGLAFEPECMMDFTKDERGVSGMAADVHGHGTHVAATIFGRKVEGTRVGIAPGVKKVLIGKVLGPQGGSTEAILYSIEWALARGADVISMSLGMDFPGSVARLMQEGLPVDIAASRTLEAYRSNVRLFDQLAALVETHVTRGRGALLVAASGNESRRRQDPRFTVATAPPAGAVGFISVGAIRQISDTPARFAVADFSNTGCHVVAPGVGILSAKRGGGLLTMSGTSMATPHVAGVIALWMQRLFPDGRRRSGWAEDVRRAVDSSVMPLPGSRADIGLGMVRAPQ